MHRFWNNFTGRFLGWPFTKIAQTVPLRWTRWPPELKLGKPLKQLLLVSWVTLYQNCTNDPLPKLFKWFRYVEQEATRAINSNKLLMTSSAKSVDRFWNNFTGMFLRWLSSVYQNCSNRFAPLNKMAARAKNRKTFKRLLRNQCIDFEIILQEGSLGDPLPKLLKQFCPIEQDGHQS